MMDDDPRLDPVEIRSARFPGSFRRYDAKAVEEFLDSVAARVSATNQLVDELRRELDGARLVRTVQPDSPPAETPDLSTMSDDELVHLVGEETAHVLATARKAANDIRTKAEEAAGRLIREATSEADRLREDAERAAEELTAEAAGVRDAAVAEATEAAAAITEGARTEAEEVLARAREEAEAITSAAEERRAAADEEVARILEEAREEGRSMVNEAKDVRSRVLEDLQRRRALGRAQVERLIAGRERILAAYAAVRENVDDVTSQLEEGLLEPSDPMLDEGFVGVVSSSAPVDEPEPEADAEEVADDGVATIEAAPEIEVAAETEGAEAPVEAEADVEPEAQEPAAAADDGSDVDALFARIRSERAESVARAQQVLAGDGSDTVAAEADEPEAVEAEVAPDETPSDEDAGDEDAGDDADDQDAGGVGRELLASAASLEHRTATIAPLDKLLSRSLKRHLADEQNVVLDVLRRTESTDPADLLPSPDDHAAGYAEVAERELRAAAHAGAEGVGAATTVDVTELALGLGATLTEPFRRRIERSAAEVDGDADALDERLRALYREWKVEHIATAAADALLGAYALGQFAGAPEGAGLRWRIDPSQGPCPDAQDNALAGVVTKGEAFPTGDRCPQAHPGCRCLLDVADPTEVATSD